MLRSRFFLKPQPEVEWTEDDEAHMKWLCRIVHSRTVHGELSLAEESELGKWMDKWLNHNPQPKQEWSEEECIRKELIDFVNHYRHNTDLTSEQAEWCKKVLAYLKKQKEELSIRLNGLMQEYVKSGKDEQEQEHRKKCYQLFWDALGDSEFFKKEQKPVKEIDWTRLTWKDINELERIN